MQCLSGNAIHNGPAVYHHTPDIGVLRPADWCVLEYASPDRLRGYAGVFKLAGSEAANYVFRPRGLDVSREYDVTFDNSGQTIRIPGRDLALAGLAIALGPALTSELLMFEAAG